MKPILKLTGADQQELEELKRIKLRLLEREKYKTDLWELCKLIGFNDLGECHKELCREVVGSKKQRQLYLYPRGHLKTSVITTANVIRLILNNPNIRILIASSTLENGKNVMKVIKNFFMINERARELFPEWCPREDLKEWGTQTAFTIANRTDITLREGTVEIASVGNQIVGRHYDVLVFSDIVNYENSSTAVQIKKVCDWVAYALSLLNRPNEDLVVMEGTRYAYTDVYGQWIDTARKDKNKFFVIKRPAIFINDKGEREALFPERFSLEALDAIKKEQGSYIYSGQYDLEPIDSETAPFKREQIRYIPRQNIPRGENNTWAFPLYMTVDPAISTSKDADYSVLTVSMFDETDTEYVIDIEYGHVDVATLARKFVSMVKKYKPIAVGVEGVAFQRLLVNVLDTLIKAEGINLPVKELVRDTRRTKAMRIMGLQPRFENHRIYFCDDLPKDFIEDQILRYNPDKRDNRDDFLDTLADLDTLRVIPSSPALDVYKLFPAKRLTDWLQRTDRDEEETFDWDGNREEEPEHEYYAYGR